MKQFLLILLAMLLVSPIQAQEITGHSSDYLHQIQFENGIGGNYRMAEIISTGADTTKSYEIGVAQFFTLFWDIDKNTDGTAWDSVNVSIRYELSPDGTSWYWKDSENSALEHARISANDTTNSGKHYISFHKPVASAISPSRYIRWIFQGLTGNDSTKIVAAYIWIQP